MEPPPEDARFAQWMEEAGARTSRWVNHGIATLEKAGADSGRQWEHFNKRVFPYVVQQVGPTQPAWDHDARVAIWRVVLHHAEEKARRQRQQQQQRGTPYARPEPLALAYHALAVRLQAAEQFLAEEEAKSASAGAPGQPGVFREALRILRGVSVEHPVNEINKALLAHASAMIAVDAQLAERHLVDDMAQVLRVDSGARSTTETANNNVRPPPEGSGAPLPTTDADHAAPPCPSPSCSQRHREGAISPAPGSPERRPPPPQQQQ
eukprot:m51a1_g12776 hypothetical protein (265) ;mRNA; r:398-1511